MDYHHHARLTIHSREQLAKRVLAGELSLNSAAAGFKLSRQSAAALHQMVLHRPIESTSVNRTLGHSFWVAPFGAPAFKCRLSTVDSWLCYSGSPIPTELIMPIPQDLLDILVCPACKAPVKPTPDNSGLKCQACRRVYPVRDEIPVMLIEEATIAPE